MDKLKRVDLLSLEDYAQRRKTFRDRVMDHKKLRYVAVGPHASIAFEDRLTIHYQVQEMLRVERIFEAQGIEDELSVYNPLIPDGDNWKATLMLEVEDADERRVALQRWLGIENRVWIKIGEFAPVFALADEDLERTTEDKTSAVHFLRFQLPAAQIDAIKVGSSLQAGIDHESYQYSVTLSDPVISSLKGDLS